MSRRSPVTPLPAFLARWRVLLTLAFCLTLALAPSLAEARAGRSSGGSPSVSGMGSRGTRTPENNNAAPITRSMTQTPQATSPVAGAAVPAAGGSFFSRHPFMTGLAGGFLGSMLFHGMGGFGNVLGGLMTVLIIAGLIWFVIRLFTGRGFSTGAPAGAVPLSVGAAASPSAARFRGRDTTVDDTDLTAFQAIHAGVQEAWGHGDLAHLRQLMTPEMLSYFSEELTRNASQGVQNIVSDVRLLKGDITESWEEGDLQYATAYMKWSAIDYVVPVGRAPAAGGQLSTEVHAPVEAEEVWTFVRRRSGNWLLSAVQQV